MLDFSSYFSLVVLGFISGASQFKLGRSFLMRHHRQSFNLSLIAIFSWQIILSLLQYDLWSDSPLARLFLPPYQEINYFIFFAVSRFFLPYSISLSVALFILFLLPKINRRFGERFFEAEEPYLAAVSVFLVGHPGWIVYFVVLIAVYLLIHLIYSLRSSGRRLSLYSLWGIVALFVILINEYWLFQTGWWSLLAV